MATERAKMDPRLAAQAAVLKEWGREWRKVHGKSQQELGRASGYGSDESPRSAAVAISRIESGKTDPTGRHRQRLLDALGRTEEQLTESVQRIMESPPQFSPVVRALAGSVFVENETRRKRIIARSNLLTERVAHRLLDSERILDGARSNFILPFLETAANVDWRPVLDGYHAKEPGRKQATPTLQIQNLREQTEVGILRSLAESAAGAVAGAGAGAGTAAGLFATVSAMATASTGTAIASLSGAAASSATLAWLGGGSLAAGGMGVAGGTAVLTGIVALPALLAVGGVLIWRGRKLRKEAEAEVEKLDAAQQALEDIDEALPRAEQWANSQQAITQRAELLGRTIHSRFVDTYDFARKLNCDDEQKVAWDDLPQDVQRALEIELSLLSIIANTQALPVWLRVMTLNEAELSTLQSKSADASDEWINESLVFAQFELDEHELWVREATREQFS